MANKRTIKRNVTAICGELFAECVAQSLYDRSVSQQNVEALIHSIVKLQGEYIRRISHVEPGMPAKKYFRILADSFARDVNEIIDQINNLH